MKGFHRLTLQVIGRAILSLNPEECETVFARLYLPIVDECNARVWGSVAQGHVLARRIQAARRVSRQTQQLLRRSRAETLGRSPGGQTQRRHCQARHPRSLHVAAQQNGSSDRFAASRRPQDDDPRRARNNRRDAHMDMLRSPLEPRSTPKSPATNTTNSSRSTISKTETSPTLKDLEKKVYGRSCLREALRKYSVVPIVMRVADDDDFIKKEESGLSHDLTIPKGTAVCVGITAVHNNPTLWPDPRKYKPERMVPLDNDMDSVKYSFLPFIAGPRNCLGQHLSLTEAQFILSYLMHQTEGLKLNEKASGVPHKFIAPVVPENGLPVDVDQVNLIFLKIIF